MALEKDILSITQLKNRAAELIAEARESGRPKIVTQNGTATAVLMDVQSYDRLKEALDFLRLAAQGRADAEAGRTSTTAAALERARAAVKAGDGED